MNEEEIFSVITNNTVPAEHIKKMFTQLLNEYLTEFIDFDGKKFFVTKQPPKISGHNINEQRSLLAKNLYRFLKQMQSQVYSSEAKEYLTVSEKEKIKSLTGLLNKKPVMEILSMANGTLTITEMAKKLDMHISNTSRIVSELKKNGLIKRDKNDRLVRTIHTIKFNLE